MGLRLNRIPDERVIESLPHTIGMIEVSSLWLSEHPGAEIKKLIQCHEGLAHNHYAVGSVLSQQERPLTEMLSHFRMATEHALSHFQLLELPTEREVREFYLFEKLLNLLACFGTPDMRQKATAIGKEIYHFTSGTHYKDSYAPSPAHLGNIAYLELLKNAVANAPWDDAAYQHAKQLCLNDLATKWEREITVRKLEAVAAAIRGDAKSWNQNITEIVRNHKELSTRGELKHSVEAFICLPGLALAKLGLERNLTCTVKSPYLPLHLLGKGQDLLI